MLGPLRLGATRGEVLKGFGEPDFKEEHVYGCATWRYGDLELTFAKPERTVVQPILPHVRNTAVVNSFNLRAFDGVPKMTGKRGMHGICRERIIELNPWFVRAGAMLDECERELHAAGFTTQREDLAGTPRHERTALGDSEIYLRVVAPPTTNTSAPGFDFPCIRLQFLMPAAGARSMAFHAVRVELAASDQGVAKR